MGLGNTSTEWGSLAKTLHWLVAIGVFVLLYLGLEQAGMERGDEKSRIRFIHASIAACVFSLMTLRLIWRWMNETPAHPEGVAPWQAVAAKIVHWALYITVFAQLVSGAMTVATNGNNLPFFGLFSIPLPVAESSEAHEFWEEIHETAWIAVAVFIGIHILGALFNHFVLKNDVMRRMAHGVKQNEI